MGISGQPLISATFLSRKTWHLRCCENTTSVAWQIYALFCASPGYHTGDKTTGVLIVYLDLQTAWLPFRYQYSDTSTSHNQSAQFSLLG